MTILQLLVTLVLIGIGLYILNQLDFIDGKIKKIINAVVFVLALLLVVEAFGLFHSGFLNQKVNSPLK